MCRMSSLKATSRWWIIVVVVAFASSCGHPRTFNIQNYTRAVKSGFSKIPEALQIESLFGEADQFISYSGPYVPQKWNTVAYFDGRYILSMEVEVETNSEFSEITKVVGEPHFFLWEADQIVIEADGQPDTKYSRDLRFGLSDWKKVFAAKGDFSVIGITIKKDQPLANWDAYVRGWSGPRIKVRPD